MSCWGSNAVALPHLRVQLFFFFVTMLQEIYQSRWKMPSQKSKGHWVSGGQIIIFPIDSGVYIMKRNSWLLQRTEHLQKFWYIYITIWKEYLRNCSSCPCMICKYNGEVHLHFVSASPQEWQNFQGTDLISLPRSSSNLFNLLPLDPVQA